MSLFGEFPQHRERLEHRGHEVGQRAAAVRRDDERPAGDGARTGDELTRQIRKADVVALSDVRKRTAIGHTFIDVFEEAAARAANGPNSSA